VEQNVPLSGLTTLGVGGPARYLALASYIDDLRHALRFARDQSLPVLVLGGGSNVLVADAGFIGVVIRQIGGSIRSRPDGSRVRVSVDAGVCWDDLVAWSVENDLAGLECLSGIPGDVGAAPIQNIGAYGQEVRDTLSAVRVLDRSTLSERRLSGTECGFDYRTSRFKTLWKDRMIVTGVELLLHPGGPAALRYPQLRDRFPDVEETPPSLAAVREMVLSIRADKSMVLSDEDPNRRSAGSFFTNPIVATRALDGIKRTLTERGIDAERMPTYPVVGGMTKLSAAWLIEQCGFAKGHTLGRAALSTRHTLALINTGEATAAELVALAAEVRNGVADKCGVTLEPEPNFVGFDRSVARLLEAPDR
jgi:UDP-N-acetylmuramate dehydrogenase